MLTFSKTKFQVLITKNEVDDDPEKTKRLTIHLIPTVYKNEKVGQTMWSPFFYISRNRQDIHEKRKFYIFVRCQKLEKIT